MSGVLRPSRRELDGGAFSSSGTMLCPRGGIEDALTVAKHASSQNRSKYGEGRARTYRNVSANGSVPNLACIETGLFPLTGSGMSGGAG